jgi:competence ComEA-like helix-hairpin-helix protein
LIELERLESLGFRTAQAIVAYREEHGPFNGFDDLQKVIGIDEMTLAMLKTEVEIQTLPIEMDPGIDDQKEPLSVEPEDEAHAILLDAQVEASVGNLDSAMKKYQRLVEKGERLDGVIADLNNILYGDVSNELCVDIYQLLGDAYLNADDLQKALEAYTKAEELLR